MSDALAERAKLPPGEIQILNLQRRFRIHRARIVSFCGALLRTLKQPAQTLSVVLVSARRIRSMNRQYLGRDYATDVLSFSYEGVVMEGFPFLGEIIIAPEVALQQAIRSGVDPEREFRKLLVHGMLHLLGYDHETDRGRMSRAQAGLLRQRPFDQPPALADMRARR